LNPDIREETGLAILRNFLLSELEAQQAPGYAIATHYRELIMFF